MQHSDTMDLLAPALCAAQAMFTSVRKGGEAKIVSQKGASYAYSYATLPDIQRAILPALAANGLCVLQGTCDEDETGFTVETTFLHKSGEWTSNRVRVPLEKPTAQAMGSGLGYGRRVGLVALSGVITDDPDDDGAEATAATAEARTDRAASPKAATPSKAVPVESYLGDIPRACPACGGKLWDNRVNKKNPKAPDWKCKDTECKDAKGFVTGGWVERSEPAGAGADPRDDDGPEPVDPEWYE